VVYGVDTGGPGSGCKAVSQQIVDLRPNYKYVSVSQLLRDAVEQQAPDHFDWAEVKQKMDAGELVDDVSEADVLEFLFIFEVFVNTRLMQSSHYC